MKRLPLKVLAGLMMLASATQAAPLDDRIPKDALVYAGWRGADSLAPEYAQSNLKAIVETAGLRNYIQQQLPNWLDRAAQQDPNAPEKINDLLSGLNIAWHHPCALYAGSFEFPAPGSGGQPKPRIAFLCDAGSDAPALMALLQKAKEKSAPPPDANLTISQDGNVVIITAGASTAADFAVHPDALNSSPVYKKAVAHISPTAAVTFFADPPAVISMIDTAAAAEPNIPPQAKQKYEAVMKALGSGNFCSLAASRMVK